jgi:hypothetical protein
LNNLTSFFEAIMSSDSCVASGQTNHSGSTKGVLDFGLRVVNGLYNTLHNTAVSAGRYLITSNEDDRVARVRHLADSLRRLEEARAAEEADWENYQLVDPGTPTSSEVEEFRWTNSLECPNVDPFVEFVRTTIASKTQEGFVLSEEQKTEIALHVQAYNAAVAVNDSNVTDLQTRINLRLQTYYSY